MKLKPILQLAAIAFPLLLACGSASAQRQNSAANQNADPFAKTAPQAQPEIDANQPAQSGLQEALVQMEWVSMSPADARKALRKFPRQSDLYQWVQQELDKADQGAVTLERLEIMRVRGGQRGKVEGLDDFPVSTEFDPQSLPSNIGLGVPAADITTSNHSTTNNITPPVPAPGGAKGEVGPQGQPGAPALALLPQNFFDTTSLPANFLKTQVTPQAFEFENLGWTVELELTFSQDVKLADINIAPEHKKFIGHMAMDSDKQILKPIFESQKLSTQVLARVGQPTLAGTISPPHGTGVTGSTTVPRVWLLFLTVNSPE